MQGKEEDGVTEGKAESTSNMNNSSYIICGIVCLAIGLPISFTQIKELLRGDKDQLGFTSQLLAGGIMAIILGTGLIIQHL